MSDSAVRLVPATDQTTLGYRDLDWAHDDPGCPVVLLHSLGADGHMWDACLPALTRRHRVLVPDARGHGRSGPAATATVEQWVQDLDTILTDAGTGPVLLAGVSMGGIQALAYAATHPDRVLALVVADSFAELETAVAQAKIAALAGQASSVPMPAVADQYIADTFRAPPPEGAQAVHRALAGMDPTSYAAAVRACFGVNITGLLQQVKAPTRVLWGDRDTKTPRALSEQIADRVPDADLRVIPNAGHLSNVDNPAAFVAELLQLADEQTTTPTGDQRRTTHHG